MTGPRAAAAYFGLVFGCGFALGTVRQLLLLPRLGERAAELIELPFMLTAIALAGRWIARRHRDRPPRWHVALGAIALAMMLGAELTMAWLLRARDPVATLVDRDPIAGAAYALGLLAFAAMPWLWARRAAAPTPAGRRVTGS
ncbi:MAG: hypothetical protein AB7O97_18740 [Planctomycetota bacterium]